MLTDIERSGYTISRKKSYFCTPTLKVVGYLYRYDSRRPIEGYIKVIQL
jgi:hypothetical protein